MKIQSFYIATTLGVYTKWLSSRFHASKLDCLEQGRNVYDTVKLKEEARFLIKICSTGNWLQRAKSVGMLTRVINYCDVIERLKMEDKQRLQALYCSQAETEEQKVRKQELIEELEQSLGMRPPKVSALVENGELDDMANDFRRGALL